MEAQMDKANRENNGTSIYHLDTTENANSSYETSSQKTGMTGEKSQQFDYLT